MHNEKATNKVRHFYSKDLNINTRIKLSTEGFTGKLITSNYKECVDLLAPYTESEKILDAGCGWGYLLSFFPRVCTPYALDISSNMLNTSKNFRKNAYKIESDIQNIPLKDNSFDKFFCMAVTGFVPNLEHALSELHRVLKPGGLGIITFTNRYGLINIPITIFKLKLGYYHRKKIFAPISRSFGMSESKKLLEKAGFNVLETYGWGISFPQYLGNKFPRVANKVTDYMIRCKDNFPIRNLSNAYIFKVQK